MASRKKAVSRKARVSKGRSATGSSADPAPRKKKSSTKKGGGRAAPGAATGKSRASSTRKRPATSRAIPRDDIRARIHEFTLKAVRNGELAVRELPSFARDVIEDAAAGLNNAVPQSSRNVLRQVVDGLTDAVAATASSTRAAVSSASARGSEFIRKDAARAVKDLRELEENFIGALERAGKSLKGAAKDEMSAIVSHAKRAGTRIKPAAESTIKAMDGRLMELGTEAAKAGARATRSAVGGALQGASGVFQALGDVVSGRGKTRR